MLLLHCSFPHFLLGNLYCGWKAQGLVHSSHDILPKSTGMNSLSGMLYNLIKWLVYKWLSFIITNCFFNLPDLTFYGWFGDRDHVYLVLELSVNGFNELLTKQRSQICQITTTKLLQMISSMWKLLENRMLCKPKLAPYIIIGTHHNVLITMALLISHLTLHYDYIRCSR